MSNRIPASLNWLIKKRSSIEGKIIRLRQERDIYTEPFDRRILKLQEDLNALDKTIRLHEIQINPKVIPTTQDQPVKKAIKNRTIKQLILRYFEKNDNKALSTKDVLDHISSNYAISDDITYPKFYKSIRNSLYAMCTQGVLECLPVKNNAAKRYYRLKGK
ncbi:hypothetical protein [Kangiella sp. TOML190]|uniref:hypothetical protein n=1 Tax=Kangiella sp. TOML190 TaxID=2931351 RepID=UPI00203CC7CC|nr:hypothetical protein [Kangiella sp. TOML190]